MKTKALAVSAVAVLALSGCASMLGPTRITGLAPIDKIDPTGTRFAIGKSTKADVFDTYGLACATQAQFEADPKHYGCIQNPSARYDGGVVLEYFQTFTVLPGALTDEAEANVSDSGVESIGYEFDASGILRNVLNDASCSRYVGTIEFKDGCYNRLP